MGKIDEFEQRIIQRGMTEEDFTEYEKLLKRVRGNFSKRQHCYTTAIQLPPQYAEQAIKLIEYGLGAFEDGWFSTYSSYLYMGHIYERERDYHRALEAYLLAKIALGSDHPGYVAELSKDLMWMKLHIDSFRYSEELEEYFTAYGNAGDFSKTFVNTEFKVAVAGIVISMHHGDLDEARRFLEKAKAVCQPNYEGKLDPILNQHKYHESLRTTPESIAFVQQLRL